MNTEHEKNARVENRVKLIYLQLLKGLYGCTDSTLFWYDLYPNTMKSPRFAVNQYYICIEKSNTNCKQCTISWYVDNTKVSHIDEEVNTIVIETIYEHFGELTVPRRNNHKFLGMAIEFLARGKVSLFMKDYIEESIDLFGEELSATVLLLTSKGLQNMNKTPTRPEKRCEHPTIYS